jgi:hypothetical protein
MTEEMELLGENPPSAVFQIPGDVRTRIAKPNV